MLMALLPLASWAQTAQLGEVGLGKYTYGDASFPVPVVKDSEGAILNATDHYDVSTVAYKEEACTNTIAASAMKADGTKYYLKITGKNAYVGQQTSVWFTVEKAPLHISYASGALDRTYGDAPVALVESNFTVTTGDLKYSQNWADIKNGAMPTSYTTANNNAGTGKAVTFVGGWNPVNYAIVYSATLTITPKDISATAVATAWQPDVVYTGNNIYGVYTILDKVGGTTLVAANNAALTNNDYKVSVANNVGTYTPTISFQNNYTGSITIDAAHSFNVTAAPITVTTKDIEVTYNNTDQSNQISNAQFEYSGIVGGDVANAASIKSGFTAPTSVTVGSAAINAGEYTLTTTGGNAGGNYYFKTYLPAKLTIKKVELAIKANATAKNLGDTDPAFTLAAPAGLIGSDYVTGVTFTRTDGEDVGSYDITPNISAAKVMRPAYPSPVDVTANYSFKVGTPKAKLTIGQGAIVVTIKDAEKLYGQEDPTFTYVVTGLQAGDELAAFTINRDKKGAANGAGEVVGSYALTATVANPNAEKYTSVTVVPGIFTIKRAQLTFTIPAQNVAIGKTKSALSKSTITVAGINNSDVAADLYDLDFNTGVTLDGDNKTTTDQTVATGIKATLKAAAQAKYEVIGDNKLDADANGDYESATGKVIVGAGTAFALNFTSVNADYDAIVAHAGETQTVTLNINKRNTREVPAGTKHTWAAKTWNTMVLPFEVTVAELSQALGYAIVNRVDAAKTTEDNVQFKLEMDKIPANEPFVVKTTNAIGDVNIAFGAKKIVAPASKYPSVDAGMGYKFVGAYNELTINSDIPTYNFLRGDNAKWAHIGATSANTWKVLPFDAYVNLTEAAAARGVTFTFQEIDGSTTAIKGVEASVENSAVKTGWYNLNGVKMQGAPTQKGIYIQNGKKVVVK